MDIQEYIRKFAAFVGKNYYLKKVLSPIYRLYNSYFDHKRNKIFRKNGLRVIDIFDKCLTSNGFNYTLAFGSMLGAVREKGFIKHDLDMDVALWIDENSVKLRDCLSMVGFKLIYEYEVENGNLGKEETYMLDGVSIDVFYIYPSNTQYPYCCDFVNIRGTVSFKDCMEKYGYLIPRRLHLPWSKIMVRTQFESLMLPICENARDILAFRYGPDYMTPDPSWHYQGENSNIIVWEEKKGIFKSY